MSGTRDGALARATTAFDNGAFLDDLRAWVAVPTESQEPARRPDLYRYCHEVIGPRLSGSGYRVQVFDNPKPEAGPFLVAGRIEGAGLPTLLTYGHGDVVRGLAPLWRKGLDPWTLSIEGDKVFGRGAVDNKGQHLIAITALEAVQAERAGKLGFNSKIIIETGEEIGSPGLGPFLAQQKELLAADVFIALDGPRQGLTRPDITLGSRGGIAFDLVVGPLREGSHHSGHFGGILADPGFILGHALATIVSREGRILVPGWTPEHVPNSVRAALANVVLEDAPGAPQPDPGWGEPGLSRAEKVYAWTSVIVLANASGSPENPVNAVNPIAKARLQIRHTVDVPAERFLPALRRHLDAQGFAGVRIEPVTTQDPFAAWRTDPDHPWVRFAAASIARSTGKPVNVFPNGSGSNPSRLFAEALDVPTLWIPNSYLGCGQHGPNEHGLKPLYREGLGFMAGLYWDAGGPDAPRR